MMRRLTVIILLFLLCGGAFAFWSSYDVGRKGLEERPWIIVLCASTNEPTVSFKVVFDHEGEHVRLDLRDEDDAPLSFTLLRGEPIRSALLQESAARFGFEPVWVKGKATVYEFQVSSRLLSRSKLQWEFGSRHDEHGLPSVGGVTEWCHLSTLAQASRNATSGGAGGGRLPSAH